MFKTLLTTLLACLLGFSGNFTQSQTSAAKPVIAVIIEKGANIDAFKLSATKLNLIYWRKQRYWPQGLPVKPVNLKANHPIRKTFSQVILGSLPYQQVDYWNGQYFNGITPPHSVDSEEAVIRYVSKTKGAIGYVNACLDDQRVKAVIWLLPEGNIVSEKPLSISCPN